MPPTSVAIDVIVNGRFLTHAVTGVQRYATEVLLALDPLVGRAKRSISIAVAVPSKASARVLPLANIRTVTFGSLAGHPWEQVELCLFARRKVLLNLTGSGPLAHSRSVTVIHDATAFAAPLAFSRGALAWYRYSQPRLARRAARLATISQFSASEIQRYMLGGMGRNILIWPCGADHVCRLHASKRPPPHLNLDPQKYIVAIASAQANKNIAQLERVSGELFDSLGLLTVIVGGRFEALSEGRPSGQFGRVLRTGYLSDADMASVVRNALCLVFPSFYEGFGIPPIEAMAMGVPVVVARTSSLPEVCGDAAAYFEYDDDRGVVERVREMCQQPRVVNDLVARGLNRARGYSWKRTARAILAEIESLHEEESHAEWVTK